MSDVPNFKPVTLDEAMDWDEEQTGGGNLREWVTAENARREAAKAEYEAQPIVIGDVTLLPGDVANLTITSGYSGTKTVRRLNCLILGQSVGEHWSKGRVQLIRYLRYGGKEGGYPQHISHFLSGVVRAEKVAKPDWIAADEQRRKDRGL